MMQCDGPNLSLQQRHFTPSLRGEVIYSSHYHIPMGHKLCVYVWEQHVFMCVCVYVCVCVG